LAGGAPVLGATRVRLGFTRDYGVYS